MGLQPCWCQDSVGRTLASGRDGQAVQVPVAATTAISVLTIRHIPVGSRDKSSDSPAANALFGRPQVECFVRFDLAPRRGRFSNFGRSTARSQTGSATGTVDMAYGSVDRRVDRAELGDPVVDTSRTLARLSSASSVVDL
jgi:hypothetical protein